ncbi:MAG: transcriptional initiation protein Tat, partial [Myxococcota bacterium]
MSTSGRTFGRRGFLKTLAGAAALTGVTLGAPSIWKKRAFARTDAFGHAKHLIYIRLRSGFRFTCAFNGDVAEVWNPYGPAKSKADGAEWGVSSTLAGSPFLDGADGAQRVALGMRAVPDLANEITVVPCVDHEPTAGSADGNHGSGLERWWTGSVGGEAGFLTLANYGLRARFQGATSAGEVAIPAFCLGDSGMARGLGVFAAHRPPVVQSGSFDGFGLSTED